MILTDALQQLGYLYTDEDIMSFQTLSESCRMRLTVLREPIIICTLHGRLDDVKPDRMLEPIKQAAQKHMNDSMFVLIVDSSDTSSALTPSRRTAFRLQISSLTNLSQCIFCADNSEFQRSCQLSYHVSDWSMKIQFMSSIVSALLWTAVSTADVLKPSHWCQAPKWTVEKESCTLHYILLGRRLLLTTVFGDFRQEYVSATLQVYRKILLSLSETERFELIRLQNYSGLTKSSWNSHLALLRGLKSLHRSLGAPRAAVFYGLSKATQRAVNLASSVFLESTYVADTELRALEIVRQLLENEIVASPVDPTNDSEVDTILKYISQVAWDPEKKPSVPETDCTESVQPVLEAIETLRLDYVYLLRENDKLRQLSASQQPSLPQTGE